MTIRISRKTSGFIAYIVGEYPAISSEGLTRLEAFKGLIKAINGRVE